MQIEVSYGGARPETLNKLPAGNFLRELMREAEKEVKRAYVSQTMLTMGNDDFTTTVTKYRNSATLKVSGSSVGFLEFGAGIGTSPDIFADEVGYDVSMGSYSEAVHGMYSQTGYRFWIWNQATFNYVPATHGMEKALTFLVQHINEFMRQKILEWLWKDFAANGF